MVYPNRAGFLDEGSVAGIEGLFAGDAQVRSDSAPALAAIQQYQLLVLTATGATPYVEANHSALKPDKLAIAHMAVAQGERALFYTAGCFNRHKIVWPAQLNTFALQKEAVLGSGISIGHPKPGAD